MPMHVIIMGAPDETVVTGINLYHRQYEGTPMMGTQNMQGIRPDDPVILLGHTIALEEGHPLFSPTLRGKTALTATEMASVLENNKLNKELKVLFIHTCQSGEKTKHSPPFAECLLKELKAKQYTNLAIISLDCPFLYFNGVARLDTKSPKYTFSAIHEKNRGTYNEIYGQIMELKKIKSLAEEELRGFSRGIDAPLLKQMESKQQEIIKLCEQFKIPLPKEYRSDALIDQVILRKLNSKLDERIGGLEKQVSNLYVDLYKADSSMDLFWKCGITHYIGPDKTGKVGYRNELHSDILLNTIKRVEPGILASDKAPSLSATQAIHDVNENASVPATMRHS